MCNPSIQRTPYLRNKSWFDIKKWLYCRSKARVLGYNGHKEGCKQFEWMIWLAITSVASMPFAWGNFLLSKEVEDGFLGKNTLDGDSPSLGED